MKQQKELPAANTDTVHSFCDDSSRFKTPFILGEAAFHEIQRDRDHLISPTWLANIPQYIGYKSGGKQKADTWRTLMTVLLPISLVRLLSSQKDLRSQAIIRNTMNLSQAIIIASKCTTSPQRAAEYEKYMKRYHKTLKALFPNFDSFSKPNFHLALHLSALLLRFGPAHGWWCYGFERLIGLLTRLGTNNKLGKDVLKSHYCS